MVHVDDLPPDTAGREHDEERTQQEEVSYEPRGPF